jgi:hypothetical protein
MSEHADAGRTNLLYLPCCHGEFDCHDKGKGCIHKKSCKGQSTSEEEEP